MVASHPRTLSASEAETSRVRAQESNVRRGWWRGENQPDQSRYLPLGTDVEGLKLGIVGMGNIGKQLALRASACGMSIFYSNRNRVEDAGSWSLAQVSVNLSAV